MNIRVFTRSSDEVKTNKNTSEVLKWTAGSNQTFTKHSSSISGGVGGGLDGGEGLFIHHFPGEKKRIMRKPETLPLNCSALEQRKVNQDSSNVDIF